MNLDIQQAWCRHWVRERLDVAPSGSLVLLISDAREAQTCLTRRHRETIRQIKTELRWHFSHPVCILLSIVDGPMKIESMCGIVDEQITVDNPTDLCGWVGAANSLLLLSSHGPSEPLAPILNTLSQVATAFRNPWNTIWLEDEVAPASRLDWEHVHQAPIKARRGETGNTSVDFLLATRMIEESLIASKIDAGRINDETCNRSDQPYEFRQAG
jgi:hypothetical protein